METGQTADPVRQDWRWQADGGGTPTGQDNAALSAMEGQRKRREALVDERKREVWQPCRRNALAWLRCRGRQIDSEPAPIRYVAELIGADTDSERAIRWLIVLTVLCCARWRLRSPRRHSPWPLPPILAIGGIIVLGAIRQESVLCRGA
jgi:hypothetical protein